MSFNEGADFWYYEKSLNIIPFDTRKKQPALLSFKEYQNNRISKEVFEQWKRQKMFDKGMALFPGQIYQESKEILFWVSIDCDTKEAIDEFCKINNVTSLTELADKFLIEQHEDDLDRAHISFISPIQFPNKAAAGNKIGIEIKSKGEHGVTICWPSFHKNGYQYKIIGTDIPITLTKEQAIEMIQKIEGIFASKNSTYFNYSKINGKFKSMIVKMKIGEDNGLTINQGERHSTLLSIANSILFKHHHTKDDFENLEMLKEFFIEFNEKFCCPEPLPLTEIDSIWKSAVNYVEQKKDFDAAKVIANKEKNKDFASVNEIKRDYRITNPQHHHYIILQATNRIMEKYHFLTIEESGDILYYRNGVYVQGAETLIEKGAEKLFSDVLLNKHVSEIKHHIMRRTYRKKEEIDSDINIINLKNGLYYINTNELKSHSPNCFSINQLPISFNSKAKPKSFSKFLSQVLYPSEIRTAIEVLAYTFYRDCPFEHFFVLLGNGSNGKSVYTTLLTELHGRKNVSNVSLSSLIENRFAMSDLENKDVNIDNELPDNLIKDTSIIKKLTGGRKQPIRIERKNQRAYDTNLYAKLFFNTNSLLKMNDQTDARYRREVIISFPNKFEGKNADPYLAQKLIEPEELSGIFNILMIALRNILKNKGLHLNEKDIEARREKNQRASNPVKSFLEEVVVAGDLIEGDYVTKEDLYDVFKRYCKEYCLPHKTYVAFCKELNKFKLISGRENNTIERKTCWRGIKLIEKYAIRKQIEETSISTF